ncbi:hypothetical protein CO051_01450 [Candidatus Roizmanbacteria bacterium CG_4_9_14_0_2_um_filter_39_13]|uniref:Uncharacterized protein n=2 Tax=Candidatus Roizmaniibacteriota TaxID=1752723 RepID=A0A2M8F287_9BACT|nr:MAG: hypothetical protein CO051_01450 [Candidatus Roizmanbacteria bacterium CG_4_9_14_0_2_um_filter_39_13]PJE62233.1 MAG: hypothetical protein COU87_00340 [Candidatus Roizmanbacteria bacterium CG10_big_fil_rev_8_21_14_0_10_39_12]
MFGIYDVILNLIQDPDWIPAFAGMTIVTPQAAGNLTLKEIKQFLTPSIREYDELEFFLNLLLNTVMKYRVPHNGNYNPQ